MLSGGCQADDRRCQADSAGRSGKVGQETIEEGDQEKRGSPKLNTAIKAGQGRERPEMASEGERERASGLTMRPGPAGCNGRAYGLDVTGRSLKGKSEQQPGGVADGKGERALTRKQEMPTARAWVQWSICLRASLW